MARPMKFYVYRHIRLDTGEPFYVGKGSGFRAYDMKWQRNKYHHAIQGVSEVKAQIIADGLSEQEAFDLEVETITVYKCLGYCSANFTAGGTGGATRTGQKHTEETKRKISVTLQGKKHTMLRRQRQRDAKLGVKHSPERSKAQRKPRGPYGPRTATKKIELVWRGR